MSNVSMKSTINTSADALWQGLRTFYADLPGIECVVAGSGVGAVRTFTLPDGGQIIERLESLDDEARTLTYAIINDSPLPVNDYLSTMQVTDTGDGECELTWSSTFEPRGVPEKIAQKVIGGVYSGGFAAFNKTFGG